MPQRPLQRSVCRWARQWARHPPDRSRPPVPSSLQSQRRKYGPEQAWPQECCWYVRRWGSFSRGPSLPARLPPRQRLRSPAGHTAPWSPSHRQWDRRPSRSRPRHNVQESAVHDLIRNGVFLVLILHDSLTLGSPGPLGGLPLCDGAFDHGQSDAGHLDLHDALRRCGAGSGRCGRGARAAAGAAAAPPSTIASYSSWLSAIIPIESPTLTVSPSLARI